MRWLVLFLVLLNVGIWYGAEALQPPPVSGAVGAGNLPRVASLKSEVPDSPPEPPEPASDAAGAAPVQAAAAQSQPEPPGLACVRLGWLENREVGEALVASQPLADEVGMVLEERVRELPSFHWVIIPPQPRPVALKQFRDIQRQGIDSYLVTEGENRNAISLGLFESRSAAISVLEEKKGQNLNAVLANFPRNQISYALVFKAEPDLAEDLVQAVEAGRGSNFDFIEINPCEGVATAEKSP